ncbi:hypothetical protein HK096_001377 [Nowakowskiella sp. JEL0078]|nr:hypothetical protein HK096_001377 [Nowakowskiella sp. JEL0078]
MMEEILNLKQAISHIESVKDLKSKENFQLREKLHTSMEHTESVEIKAREYHSEIMSVRNENFLLQNKYSALEQKLIDLKSKHVFNEESKIELNSVRNNVHQGILDDSNEKVSILQSELESCSREKNTFQTRLLKAQENIAETEHAKLMIDQENMKIKEDLKSALSRCTKAESKVLEMVNEVELSRKDFSARKEKFLELKLDFDLVSNAKRLLEQQIIDLKINFQNSQQMNIANENLKKTQYVEINELRKQINAFKIENNSISECKFILEKSLTDLNLKLQRAEKEKFDLSNSLNMSSAALEDIKIPKLNLQNSLADSQKFHESSHFEMTINKKIQDLEKRLRNAESEKTLLIERLSETENYNDTLQRKSNQMEKDMTTSNMKMKEIQDQLEKSVSKLSKLQKKNLELEETIKEQLVDILKRDTEKDLIQQALQGEIELQKDQTIQITKLQENNKIEITDLIKKNKLQNTFIDELEAQILKQKQNAENYVLLLQKANSKVEFEKFHAEEQLKEKRELLEKYISQVEASNAAKNQIENQKQNLEITLSKKDSELKIFINDLENFKSQQEQARIQLKNLEDRNLRIESSWKEISIENESLRKSRAQLESEKKLLESLFEHSRIDAEKQRGEVDSLHRLIEIMKHNETQKSEKSQLNLQSNSDNISFTNTKRHFDDQINNLTKTILLLQERITFLELPKKIVDLSISDIHNTTALRTTRDLETLVSFKDREILRLESDLTLIKKEKEMLLIKLDTVHKSMNISFDHKIRKIVSKVESQARDRELVDRIRNENQKIVQKNYEQKIRDLSDEIMRMRNCFDSIVVDGVPDHEILLTSKILPKTRATVRGKKFAEKQ